MPGSSLWLVPPPDRPLHKILRNLIETKLPAQFPADGPPLFAPHLTLTSNIDPDVYGDEPQKWLESIPWPTGDQVRVQFEGVKTEDVFFRRLYIKVAGEGVEEVAGIARARGVNGEDEVGPKTTEWLKEWAGSFGPHVSLMYGNTSIDGGKLRDIERVVEEAPISFKETTSLSQGSIETNGWEGGVVWLVPTDRSIEDWKPIATKTL